jgi:nucleoside-diphosphate-sugar epimerase
VKAGVPRFFPSDFSADFTKTRPGRNRNLDLRREFMTIAQRAPIALTSILNGAFAELLSGEAPFLIYPIHRALAWGDPDQKMDFTTKDDVAAFTAQAAMDHETPRILRIAGSEVSASDLARIASDVTGQHWKVLRPGSTTVLSGVIRVARVFQPGERELYPAWQGMQYMRDMMEGDAKLSPLDNDRYPMKWTSAREVIASHARH